MLIAPDYTECIKRCFYALLYRGILSAVFFFLPLAVSHYFPLFPPVNTEINSSDTKLYFFIVITAIFGFGYFINYQ